MAAVAACTRHTFLIVLGGCSHYPAVTTADALPLTIHARPPARPAPARRRAPGMTVPPCLRRSTRWRLLSGAQGGSGAENGCHCCVFEHGRCLRALKGAQEADCCVLTQSHCCRRPLPGRQRRPSGCQSWTSTRCVAPCWGMSGRRTHQCVHSHRWLAYRLVVHSTWLICPWDHHNNGLLQLYLSCLWPSGHGHDDHGQERGGPGG